MPVFSFFREYIIVVSGVLLFSILLIYSHPSKLEKLSHILYYIDTSRSTFSISHTSSTLHYFKNRTMHVLFVEHTRAVVPRTIFHTLSTILFW